MYVDCRMLVYLSRLLQQPAIVGLALAPMETGRYYSGPSFYRRKLHVVAFSLGTDKRKCCQRVVPGVGIGPLSSRLLVLVAHYDDDKSDQEGTNISHSYKGDCHTTTLIRRLTYTEVCHISRCVCSTADIALAFVWNVCYDCQQRSVQF